MTGPLIIPPPKPASAQSQRENIKRSFDELRGLLIDFFAGDDMNWESSDAQTDAIATLEEAQEKFEKLTRGAR